MKLRFVSLFTLALAAAACGGSKQEAKDAHTTAADLSPMDELKAIPTDLDAEVTALTKPIDETQAVIEQITSIPTRHKINAGEVMGMARGTLDGGKVEVSLKGDASAEAKAELKAALEHLAQVVVALKATPDRVASLTKKVAAATAKVPVLGTKITAEASVKASNPFASADSKAKAQADSQAVAKVQQDVTGKINEVQQKVTSIPASATGALGKLAAAFAGGASASTK